MGRGVIVYEERVPFDGEYVKNHFGNQELFDLANCARAEFHLAVTSLHCAKLFQSKPGIFEDAKKQTLWQIFSAMYWNGDCFSIRVLQDQVGPRLAGFDVAMGAQKANQFASVRHA